MKKKIYHCKIGGFSRDILSESPEKAAESCVTARCRSYDWFANQSPMAASVMVDGVEYDPAAYAGPETLHVWGD